MQFGFSSIENVGFRLNGHENRGKRRIRRALAVEEMKTIRFSPMSDVTNKEDGQSYAWPNVTAQKTPA